MVGVVEHHALASAQGQHGVAHLGGVGAGARLGAQRRGQLAVAQRRAAAVRVEGELDLERDRGIGVLESACPVTESELVSADPAVHAGGTVEQPDPPDRVCDLRSVGADVLHRGRARRAGDAREAFEAAEAVLQCGDDDVVPDRARLGTQDVAVDVDACVGEPHHGQAGHLVGHHDVRATREHQRPFRRAGFVVQRPDHGDDRLGGLAGDHAFRDRTDAQGGQRCQRHLLHDGDTPYQRTDHGR